MNLTNEEKEILNTLYGVANDSKRSKEQRRQAAQMALDLRNFINTPLNITEEILEKELIS